jgi:hypothetical protein
MKEILPDGRSQVLPVYGGIDISQRPFRHNRYQNRIKEMARKSNIKRREMVSSRPRHRRATPLQESVNTVA